MFKVNPNDEFPKCICFPCVAELNRCYSFREKCIRTWKVLSSFYKNDGSDEEEKIIEILIPEEKSDDNQMVISQSNIESSNTDNAHLIEVQSLESEEKRNEISEEGMVLVYCIADDAEEPTTEKINSAFKCSICAMEFVRKKNYENHYRRYHENDEQVSPATPHPIRIQLGAKEKSSQDDLKEKLKYDPNAKNCKHCGALFINEKSLKIHERRKNCQLKTFMCIHCKKAFTGQLNTLYIFFHILKLEYF